MFDRTFHAIILKIHRQSRSEKRILVSLLTQEYGVVDIFCSWADIRKFWCDIGVMICIKQRKKTSGYSYTIDHAGQTFARMDLDYHQISTLLAWFSLIYKTLAKGERADSVYRDITTLYSYMDRGAVEFQRAVFFCYLRLSHLMWILRHSGEKNHSGVITIMKIVPFLSHSSLTELMQITGITHEHQEAVYRIITPQFYEFTR
jgi:hypothetical protein